MKLTDMPVKTSTSCWLETSPIWLRSVLFRRSKERNLLTLWELSSWRLPPRLRLMLNRPFWPWHPRSRHVWRLSLRLLELQQVREECLFVAKLSRPTTDAARQHTRGLRFVVRLLGINSSRKYWITTRVLKGGFWKDSFFYKVTM